MSHDKVVMADEKKNADVEKDAISLHENSYAQNDWHYDHAWTRKLLRWGLETRGTYIYGRFYPSMCPSLFLFAGITPVAESERVDTQYSKIFFIWLSANFNILS